MINCKCIDKRGICRMKCCYAQNHKCFGEDMCECREPMTNANHIRSLSDEELAKELIYLAYFNDYDYDWEEELIDNWQPYYVCSDDERFDSEEEATEHEIDWLRQPYKERRWKQNIK